MPLQLKIILLRYLNFFQIDSQVRRFKMRPEDFDGLQLPAAADMHVHLRDGAMMELVTPMIPSGGVDTVFVMVSAPLSSTPALANPLQPNLVPPLTTVERVVAYRSQLQALAPSVTFLMSLYLHPSITPATIAAAAAAGITGVKSYPAGVTTNSAAGVLSYEPFYPVFAAMQHHGLVLNLHGELPPSPDAPDITVLSAEEAFLPTLHALHARFPTLRIVLEHCTTRAALDAVRACGPAVVATITAHHLHLIVDDWAGDPHAFCKPVAKHPADRLALLRAAVAAEPKFFFGSDSAPHPVAAKTAGEDRRQKCAAGCFTQPFATQLVLDAVRKALARGTLRADEVSREALEGFLCWNGRQFYGLPSETGTLRRMTVGGKTTTVPMEVSNEDGSVVVVPFGRGMELPALTWAS